MYTIMSCTLSKFCYCFPFPTSQNDVEPQSIETPRQSGWTWPSGSPQACLIENKEKLHHINQSGESPQPIGRGTPQNGHQSQDSAIYQPKGKPTLNSTSTTSRTLLYNQVNSTDIGFQHSTRERQNIARGKTNLRAATLNQPDIRGESNNKYRLRAAEDRATNLVYIGRLAPNTQECDIRSHLKDIGIDDIADVFKLQSRHPHRESSYCVSIDSDRSMKLVFDSQSWPLNVIVRPFRPPRTSISNRSSQTSSYRNGSYHSQARSQTSYKPMMESDRGWYNRSSEHNQDYIQRNRHQQEYTQRNGHQQDFTQRERYFTTDRRTNRQDRDSYYY